MWIHNHMRKPRVGALVSGSMQIRQPEKQI